MTEEVKLENFWADANTRRMLAEISKADHRKKSEQLRWLIQQDHQRKFGDGQHQTTDRAEKPYAS